MSLLAGLALSLSTHAAFAHDVVGSEEAGRVAQADKKGGDKKSGDKKNGDKKSGDKKAAPTEKAEGKAQKAEGEPAEKKARKPHSGKLDVTWLGHAAFEVVTPEGTRLLIDPFLSHNPSTPADRKDLSAYAPDLILVTHSHADHVGDAVEIAKKTGAPIVAAHDFVSSLEIPDGQKMGGNVGGRHTFKDVTVRFVPAVHGSKPGGRPVGFVIEVKGASTIYHSGDTWIFSDMALIDELYAPKILLMNSGGGPYTQAPEVAELASKRYFKKAKHIIPMHFGTFPPLATEADVQKAFKGDKRFKLLKPGETAQF